MFSKILIANRGEIACRVAATAKRMGVHTVAVYSDADRYAKHVSVCDEAVYLGGASPKDSYLKADLLINIAQQTGAQAIHPGYGFLSENAAFAQACADAGIVFIGPSAAAITAMGLKAESKRLMETAGVPLIPGYHGNNQDPEFLLTQADRIGYPLLIKASSGGGGKGMRLVEQHDDFISLLDACRREAVTSFGNDAVLIEKYALNPRHIEIQVFGDSHGNYVHLFERDCSVQRRHQKVLEEAPAPNVDSAMRAAMGTAAINAARSVNYVGAGTVEFIVEQRRITPITPITKGDGGKGDGSTSNGFTSDGFTSNRSESAGSESAGFTSADGTVAMHFYFMEMNTRLQVEHPVTETITGMDLVEWQLLVAAGGNLPYQQQDLTINGHAIEARICAENPDNHFLPATGTLLTYRKPIHTTFSLGAVRIDDGVEEGDVISPFYDSMIAKLIVHAPSREQALAKLDQALAQTRIVGLPNNVAFLRYVLATPSFSQATLDTALIEREKDKLFAQQPLSLPTLVTAAVLSQFEQEQRAIQTQQTQQIQSGSSSPLESASSANLVNSDPFNSLGGWRAYSEYQRRFDLVLHQGETEQGYQAQVSHIEPAGQQGGQRFELSIGLAAPDADAPVQVEAGHQSSHQHSQQNSYQGVVEYQVIAPNSYVIWLEGQRLTLQSWIANGKVHIFTEIGSGEIVLIDAMAHVYDETQAAGSLKSPMPGQVVAFKVAVGDTVKQGQALALIEAMKIVHTINAPVDGVVAELLFAPGDLVADGDELLRLDTE